MGHNAACSDWCESDGWIHNLRFWIQLFDSSVQAGFPKKIGQKVRGVSETHGNGNVTYATAMSDTHSHAALHTLCIWNLSFKPRFHTQYALCKSDKKWKTYKCTSMILYVWPHMQQNGWLNQYFYDPVVNFLIQPSNSSVQAGFPKKIGKQVRGVSKTHEYHNVAYAFGFACCLHLHLVLGVAGTHRQLWIMDYKYRYLANFHLKKALVWIGKWLAISTSPA